MTVGERGVVIVVLKHFALVWEDGAAGTGRTMAVDGEAGDVEAGGHALIIHRLCSTVIPMTSVHMVCAAIELMEWELVHLRGVEEDGVEEDGDRGEEDGEGDSIKGLVVM